MKVVFFILLFAGGFWLWQSRTVNDSNQDTDEVEQVVEQSLSDSSVVANEKKSDGNAVTGSKENDLDNKQRQDAPPVEQPPITQEVISEHSSMSREEIQEITQEVLADFDAIDIPRDIPEDKAERFTLLNNMYLKTSYYLNEVAAGNIVLSREDLAKAFSIMLLYGQENDFSDSSDVLNMLEKDNPQVFQEAIRELPSQQDIDKIRQVQELVQEESWDN